MSGLELLQAVHTINPETPVILITAFGTIEAAVAALKHGAIDYLTKPLNLDELLYRIRQVSDRYRIINENRELREALQDRHRIEGIIGESGPMLEVLSIVRRVAPSEATVLIRGESGTGKELIAKAIHFGSPRARGPLVKVNCAALPEALLESELFGHEKGAFTGALTSRQGRFELANGGTIFLDEIGDLPLHLQAKLLRVLQEREFEKVGSSRPVQGQRQNHGGEPPTARGSHQSGTATRRSLLSAQCSHDFHSAAAGKALRCCAADRPLPAPLTRRKTARRSAGLRLKAGTFFYATTIREMSESWKILSSARWCSPGMM